MDKGRVRRRCRARARGMMVSGMGGLLRSPLSLRCRHGFGLCDADARPKGREASGYSMFFSIKENL